MKLGELYKKLRFTVKTELGESISIKDFADEIGLSAPRISELENNKREMSLTELKAYHKYFNVSFEYLLGETDISSIDEDVQTACKVTGLSEDAIKKIMYINDLKHGRKFTKEGEKDILAEREEIEAASEELENMYSSYKSLREQLQSYIEKIPYKSSPKISPELDEAFKKYATISLSKDDLDMLIDQEKYKGDICIEALNAIFSSVNFDEFIFNLSIYRITDFSKNNKKIWSVSANENGIKDQGFIFDTQLIEHGLLSKIQQFIISLKEEIPRNTLVDIEEFNRNGDEEQCQT